MSVRKPPALATWLLRRLGCVAQTQSFLGDLAEQFASGRSRSWYRRQALAAVTIGLARTARRHGPSFVAAIVSAYLLGRVFELVDPTLLRPIFNPLWWRDELQGTTDFLLRFRFSLLVGVLHIGLCLFTGWLVTKVHRAHPRAVLLTFVAVLSVGPVLWILRLGFDLQGNLRFLQSFVQASLSFLGGSSLTLLGGLLGARRGARAKASRALDRVIAFGLLVIFLTHWTIEAGFARRDATPISALWLGLVSLSLLESVSAMILVYRWWPTANSDRVSAGV